MTEEVKTEAEKGQEQMDAANLFREEIYTDRKIGVIRCLVPVTAEGKVDESRKVIYTGEAQIMTQMGALPISFDGEEELPPLYWEGYDRGYDEALEAMAYTRPPRVRPPKKKQKGA